VTAADCAKCARAAGNVSVSEWARGPLPRDFDQHTPAVRTEQHVMTELWALRYIVINGLPTPTRSTRSSTGPARKKADKARAILEGGR
jgi:hypothetical protein